MDKVNKVMKNDEEQLETHFVENPYIKLRERALNKEQRAGIGAKVLQEEATDNDIYILEESGKMVVNDLEGKDTTAEERRKKRKTEGYGVDSDTDSDDE